MLSAKRIKGFSDLWKSNSQSADITDSADVLQEIFVKLSIKVLLSFKCVSKHWLSIISDPQFGYLHFCRNPCTIAGLILYNIAGPHVPEYDFIFLSGETNINPFRSLTFVDGNSDIHRIWSCKGLLCLCIVRSPFYKVVCVWIAGMVYRFSVYSSETKVWRDAHTSLEVGNNDYYLFRRGVFWNNSVHWVSKLGPFLRFDMDKECIEMIPATDLPTARKQRRIRYFGESHGHLHLIEIPERGIRFFNILEMKRDYSEWFVRYRVDFKRLGRILSENELYHGKFYILYIFQLETEEDTFGLVLSNVVSTYLFLVSDNSCYSEKMRHFRYDLKDNIHYKWYNCHQHFMTLASV